MNAIDWNSIHGYNEWAHLLARLLGQAQSAPDTEARTTAEQALAQFRARVPGYGDDLNDLARQAINALLLTNIAAGLRELATVQQQLAGLLHGPLALASLTADVPPATQRALKEASSWLLPLVKPGEHATDSPRHRHLARLQLALQQLMATYNAPE